MDGEGGVLWLSGVLARHDVLVLCSFSRLLHLPRLPDALSDAIDETASDPRSPRLWWQHLFTFGDQRRWRVEEGFAHRSPAAELIDDETRLKLVDRAYSSMATTPGPGARKARLSCSTAC